MPPFPQSADESFSNILTSRYRSPLKFFLLVFALSFRSGWSARRPNDSCYRGFRWCAHVRLPDDRGFDSRSRREQDREHDRAAKEIIRLQANQRESLVWADPPSDARRDGVVVRGDALDGGPFRRRKSRFCRHSPCSLCFSSPLWVKSWAGRDTSLTRCSIGGARSRPAFSWGWYGRFGTSYRWCRLTDRLRGSPGGGWARWQRGS